MTTERIDVIVTERGARTVRRNIEGIGQGATLAQGAVQLLRRTLVTLGAAFGVREVVRLVDSYTNLQNRLKTVTQGTAELGAVTQELFAVANRTRSSFENTVETFTRAALAVRELGIAQQQTINFTESLNQAILLSGATTQEANNALIQFSQGLASGALRGDELRSVLEQLPVVADVIAKEMGVARGELRELGRDGSITAGLILNAFKNAREELAERFAKTIPTIGQAFQVLRNQVVRLAGRFSEATGIAEGFARAIISISEEIETLGRVALAAGLAIGTVLVAKGLVTASIAMATLIGFLALNPFTTLLLGIVGTTAALVAWSDQIAIGEGRLGNLQDFAKAAFESLKRGVKSVADFFLENFGFIGLIIEKTFKDVEFSFAGIVRVAARSVDSIVGFFKGASEAISIAFSNIPTILGVLFAKILNDMIAKIVELTNFVVALTNFISTKLGSDFQIDPLEGLKIQGPKDAEELGKSISQAIADGIKNQRAAEDILDGILDRAEEIAAKRIAEEERAAAELEKARKALNEPGTPVQRTKANAELEKFLRNLRQENTLLRLNTREREIQAVVFDAVDAAKRALTETEERIIRNLAEENRSLREQEDLLKSITGPLEDYTLQMEILQKILDSGAISVDQFNNKAQELRRTFLELQEATGNATLSEQFELVFLQFGDEAKNAAEITRDAFTTVFETIGRALDEFVETGKISFRSLISSMLADIGKMLAQQAFQQFIGILLGGLGGGLGGGGAAIGPLGAGSSTFLPANFNRGGLVKGPGTARSDSIRANLSNGEFVVNAAATRKNLRTLLQINNGTDSNTGFDQIAPPATAIALRQDNQPPNMGELIPFLRQQVDATTRQTEATERLEKRIASNPSGRRSGPREEGIGFGLPDSEIRRRQALGR